MADQRELEKCRSANSSGTSRRSRSEYRLPPLSDKCRPLLLNLLMSMARMEQQKTGALVTFGVAIFGPLVVFIASSVGRMPPRLVWIHTAADVEVASVVFR